MKTKNIWVRVGKQNRIVIPKKVADELKIGEGDIVCVVISTVIPIGGE